MKVTGYIRVVCDQCNKEMFINTMDDSKHWQYYTISHNYCSVFQEDGGKTKNPVCIKDEQEFCSIGCIEKHAIGLREEYERNKQVQIEQLEKLMKNSSNIFSTMVPPMSGIEFIENRTEIEYKTTMNEVEDSLKEIAKNGENRPTDPV